jgi:hypothetical protein
MQPFQSRKVNETDEILVGIASWAKSEADISVKYA